jgi:hypothetical protein
MNISVLWQMFNLLINKSKKDVDIDVDDEDNDIQEINGNPITLWLILFGIFFLFLIIGVVVAVYLF